MKGDVITQSELDFLAELNGLRTVTRAVCRGGDEGALELARWVGDFPIKYCSLLRERMVRGAGVEPGRYSFDASDPTPSAFRMNAEESRSGGTPRATTNKGRRQTFVVWTCIAAVVALGLFPPWAGRGGYPLGYHLIFTPPPQVSGIDQSRLILEWVLVLVVTAGLLLRWPLQE